MKAAASSDVAIRRLHRPLLWLALAATAAAALALDVPFLGGRVNDYAAMIDVAAEERISRKLEDFERRTGSQVAVLTIESLEGEVLEEFSHRVAETWGLGRKDEDDGVLLLIARRDRKMRIEVGYGLEAELTDAESGRILRGVIAPHFQRGAFEAGIEAGVDAILGALAGAEVMPVEAVGDGRDAAGSEPLGVRLGVGLGFVLVVGTFSLNALLASGGQSWLLYVLLMPFWFAFPATLLGPRGGVICLGTWIVVFPLFRMFLRSTTGRRWVASHPGWTGWSSGGGFSSGGWGGGRFGGGFSGGGGSFGGGGASGRW